MALREKFTVVEYYPDGSYDYIERFVPVEVALATARRLTERAHLRTMRVIITDERDDIAWEWQRGKGITFPKGGTYDPAEGI